MKKNKAFTLIELIANLGFVSNFSNEEYDSSETTPTWIYNYDYWYWTMTTNTDETANVWVVYTHSYAYVNSCSVKSVSFAVRPVIVLPKSAL